MRAQAVALPVCRPCLPLAGSSTPGLVTPCSLAQDGARPAELSLQAAPAGRSGTDHFHLLLNKHCKCFLSVFGNGSHNCFLCAEGTGQLQPQGRAQRDSGTETAPARAPAAQGLSPAHESQNQPSSRCFSSQTGFQLFRSSRQVGRSGIFWQRGSGAVPVWLMAQLAGEGCG